MVPWLLTSLVIAGIASALLYIDSIEALTDTTYGRLVIAKAVILGAVTGLGLLVRLALLAGTEGRRRLRVLAGVETALLAVVLAVVAVLIQTVPAKTALLETDTAQAAPAETAVLVTTDAFTAQLVLEPGRPGPNSVRILADTPEGTAFPVVEWEAYFGPEDGESELLRLIELRTGILAGETSLTEGRWIFTITLTDAAGTTATAEATVDIT